MSVSYKCETEFWMQVSGNETNAFLRAVREPVAAASGLYFIVVALAWNGGLTHTDLRLAVARASLFASGLGTVVYHCIDGAESSHVNGTSFDGVTMALFTVSVFALHLNGWMKRHTVVVSIAFMLYLLFWILTNDSETFAFLCSQVAVQGTIFPIAVQYPTFIVPYIYIFVKVIWESGFSAHWRMWCALAFAVVFWVLYEFLCSVSTAIFFAHALWHLGISYVCVHLMALGVDNTYDNLSRMQGSEWWPQFEEKMGPKCQGGMVFDPLIFPRIHWKHSLDNR